jgi:hypothetical protein
MAVGYGAFPQAPRNPTVELGHDLIAMTAKLVLGEAGCQQSDSAADVESHPARRNHPSGIDVGGSDPTDRESVSPMDVGHRERSSDNSRQFGDIRHLAHSLIAIGSSHERL